MDMVISAGKSRKNVDAFVLIPPDAREAIDILLKKRDDCGVPTTNQYLFARINADTPLSGHTELANIVKKCDNIQYPERINSRGLRKYIATVSQVCIHL